jgi:hypothetical protein
MLTLIIVLITNKKELFNPIKILVNSYIFQILPFSMFLLYKFVMKLLNFFKLHVSENLKTFKFLKISKLFWLISNIRCKNMIIVEKLIIFCNDLEVKKKLIFIIIFDLLVYYK